MNNESMEGKIVFLEPIDPKKSYPGAMEIVVTRETPSMVYGVPYNCIGNHTTTEYSFQKSLYNIVSVTSDWPAVAQFAADLRFYGETPQRGEKKSWVESVYSQALASAKRLQTVLAERQCIHQAPGCVLTYTPVPTVSRTEYAALAERTLKLEQTLAALQMKLRAV